MSGEERVTTYSGSSGPFGRVLRATSRRSSRGEGAEEDPEVIDVYEVTGEYDIIATARTNDLHKLRSLISEKLMRVRDVKVVTTSVFLRTYKFNSKEIYE
jgi:DNA-binding Lrp family transcriptional regulator